MQLYALNDEDVLISASHAIKQQNYTCFECKSSVRLRGGLHRQNHFYHIKPNRKCKLGGKSLLHLTVQCHLQRLLPGCLLEHHFSQINRIADVFWPSKKIVFEVQVSPISAQEILARNHDYALLGYQVVWLLHDKRYNKYQITAAEEVLKDHPHYFTSINTLGQGAIYDQLDCIRGSLRVKREAPFIIDITLPQKIIRPIIKVPELIENRLNKWPFSFSGDLLSRLSEPALRPLLKSYVEKTLKKTPWSYLQKWVVRPYYALFQICLEKACR